MSLHPVNFITCVPRSWCLGCAILTLENISLYNIYYIYLYYNVKMGVASETLDWGCGK